MRIIKTATLIMALPLAACVQPAPVPMTGVPVAAAALPPAAAPAARAPTAPAQPRTTPGRGPITIPEAPTYSGTDAPSKPIVIDLYD